MNFMNKFMKERTFNGGSKIAQFIKKKKKSSFGFEYERKSFEFGTQFSVEFLVELSL